jgi:hypothetical protein
MQVTPGAVAVLRAELAERLAECKAEKQDHQRTADDEPDKKRLIEQTLSRSDRGFDNAVVFLRHGIASCRRQAPEMPKVPRGRH